ncbi:MAG: hypothetical protein ACKV2O_19565 [Acidimicrobiales bacterium]
MAPNPPLTREQLRTLALHRTATPMTSCYVNVDGRRFGRPQELQRSVDLLLRRGREAAAGDRSRLADLDRIGAYIRQGLDRSHTRGLAFFAHHDDGFWQVVSLPCPVPNHVIGALAPSVAPLEVALADHEPIGVLLVDRAAIRMLVFAWDELVDHTDGDQAGTAAASPGEADTGRDQGTSDQKADQQAARQARQAARVCFEVQARNGFGRLVLGGPEAMVAEVERCLHPYLRKIYHGRIAPHPGANMEDIGRAVRAAEIDIARTREAALVDRLRHSAMVPTERMPGNGSGTATANAPLSNGGSGAGGAGRASSGRAGRVGLADVLAVLATHRVERILVSDGFEEAGWRCPGCARLAVRGPRCPDCSTAMDPVTDVVSVAIDQAIAERAAVHVCVDCADLDVLGRIGALLRY